MKYTIKRNMGDARVINLSGRQRMLSQRMTKCVLTLSFIKSGEEWNRRSKELNESLCAWEAAHNGLQFGDDKLDLPRRENSPEIKQLFVAINPSYTKMVVALQKLAAISAARAKPDPAAAGAVARILLEQEPEFLALMDTITFQFDREAEKRVKLMSTMETFILLIGMVVLLLEFLLVFRPSLKQLSLMLGSLQQKKEQLEKLNQSLVESEANAQRLAREAQAANHAKSNFLANMSHEIRTPMNGILGFAELLKEPKLSGAEQQKYLNIIEKSGERMLNTINDIVNISKVESGQMELTISTTNINEQIEYIYTFFRPETAQRGIELSYLNSLPDNDAVINTDREKVYAILTNLVMNAIKFTHAGSITFGYEPKGEFLQFFVKDTGVGIPKDLQSAVFERFVQVHMGEESSLQGSGLGLSIAKGYVELLGGKIWLESEEGRGTTFYFTLPCSAVTETKDDYASTASVVDELPVKGLKILIAEDDEKSAMLLEIMLKKFGREILKADTGIKALELCSNNPDLDLILMDSAMPTMDGYEVARQIRLFNTKVIIIAQSAHALNGEREKAIAAGCNDYISKPVNIKVLLAILKKFFIKGL
jgi:signal transduction histidine kinase